jgi:ABC-type Na+ efflux pump permease subunit
MFGGGVWPVVQRELRAAARWPLGSWLRMGGALGGVIVLCSITAEMPAAIVGAQLFGRIHLLLLGLICGLVPALTADCIARERREGTLGLLFMTPLTASGIVLGKILAQTLRVLTLWLAVLPILTIPFLYGGITWADVAVYLIIEWCAGMLCLAAGILASCLTENRAIAFVLAFLLMAAFVDGARHYQNGRMLAYVRGLSARPVSTGPWNSTYFPGPPPGFRFRMTRPGAGVYVFPSPGPFGVAAGPLGLPSRRMPPQILAEIFAVAAVILLAAFRFAGWCVERSWQDKIPSVRRENWVRRYCTPLFERWFARSMKRALERNPIAWLQQYSWKARLSKWGLCLLFVLLECAVIDGNQPYDIGRMLRTLLLILAAAYTYAGVNGFLQEKKTGALELILVSPISVKQIIYGRVWGLWKQFLPAALLLVGACLATQVMLPHDYFDDDFWKDGWFWMIALELVAIYLILPIMATYAALRIKNLFLAALWTWIALLAPIPFMGIIGALLTPMEKAAPFLVVVIGNISLALFVFYRLGMDLERRNYSF